MDSDWNELTLRDAGIILIDCLHKTPPEVKEGYPYIAIPQLKNGQLIFEEARKITFENFQEWTKKAKPQAYDVVLSRRCNPGETAYVPPDKEFALGQNLVILRSDGKIVYPPFLRWLLRCPKWWVEVKNHINVGAVFDSLKCADIPNFKIMVPPFDEQKIITKVLSDIDSKIFLLKKQNHTLEDIGKIIFKKWFVNFEFPNKDGQPYKSSGGKMKSVSSGEIPDDWNTGFLDDGLTSKLIKPGITSFNNEKIYLDTASVQRTDIIDTSTKITLQEKPSRANMQSLPKSIWFAKMKNSKKILLIGEKDEYIIDNMILSTGFAGLECLNDYCYYIWNIINSDKFEIEKNLLCHGTTMEAINNESIRKINFVIPNSIVLNKFNDIVADIYQKISLNRQQIISLEKAQDILLPKLMSGKIRVPIEVSQ